MADKKNKGGRPPIPIDWDEVKKLCELQCTAEEIAYVIGCTAQTLDNRIKKEFGIGCLEFLEKNRSPGKTSLRRMQWKAAEGGNVAMLIWLGKQWLDQRDKKEIEEKSTRYVIPMEGGKPIDRDEWAREFGDLGKLPDE